MLSRNWRTRRVAWYASHGRGKNVTFGAESLSTYKTGRSSEGD